MSALRLAAMECADSDVPRCVRRVELGGRDVHAYIHGYLVRVRRLYGMNHLKPLT